MQEQFSPDEYFRLRVARKEARFTLKKLAELSGFAISTISEVESGKAQPSARMVARIVDVLQINPDWLKTGKGPIFAPKEPPQGEPYGVLHKGINLQLSKLIESAESNIAAAKSLQNLFGIDVSPKHTKKEDLTTSSEVGICVNVQPTLTSLLDQVRKLTAPPPRGKMAELAKYLGVPQSRVSEWLNHTCKPDGEHTLKLLHWVQEQRKET